MFPYKKCLKCWVKVTHHPVNSCGSSVKYCILQKKITKRFELVLKKKKKHQQQIDFLLKVEKCSCWWLNYSVIWKRLTKNFINYTHLVFKLFPLEEILNRSCNDLKRPVLGSGKKVYLFGWSLLVKIKE